MSFSQINKIGKLINNIIADEEVSSENYHNILTTSYYTVKKTFDITFDFYEKIFNRLVKPTYFYEKIQKCFPEFKDVYDEVIIPEEYIEKENQFQKLKALPQPEQRSEAWYLYRHNRITASDTAAAIDENPYEPVESFIQKKADPDYKPFDNANVYHGKKFEPIATQIYEHIYNAEVVEFGALPSDKYPLLGASPDGICSSKTLDNKFSTRLGTMLEIKCVVPNGRKIETSGDIPGHICPYYYYLQVQQQLECCDLDICDFWQCKLTEYKSREEYLMDSCDDTYHTVGVNGERIEIDNKLKKGILIKFYPFKFEPAIHIEDDQIEWKSKFIYPPSLNLTAREYDIWFAKTMSEVSSNKEFNDYYFKEIIYWKLEQSHNQPIERDRKLFQKVLPLLEQTWERVVYYRNNLDKLDELNKVIERRKKYIRTDTTFHINTDVIKNDVLFLDEPYKKPVKETRQRYTKTVVNGNDFVSDDEDISTVVKEIDNVEVKDILCDDKNIIEERKQYSDVIPTLNLKRKEVVKKEPVKKEVAKKEIAKKEVVNKVVEKEIVENKTVEKEPVKKEKKEPVKKEKKEPVKKEKKEPVKKEKKEVVKKTPDKKKKNQLDPNESDIEENNYIKTSKIIFKQFNNNDE